MIDKANIFGSRIKLGPWTEQFIYHHGIDGLDMICRKELQRMQERMQESTDMINILSDDELITPKHSTKSSKSSRKYSDVDNANHGGGKGSHTKRAKGTIATQNAEETDHVSKQNQSSSSSSASSSSSSYPTYIDLTGD